MEWISVNDKLPEFGEHVLVYCQIYGQYIAYYHRISGTNYGNWHNGNTLGILPPLYWMPLPEPPKK